MTRSSLRRSRGIAASVALALCALPAATPAADDLDCSFFEEQAREKEPTDYSVRMAEACRALTEYKHRLAAENVRYAYGDAAVAADPRANAHRGRYLDTFHVLSDMDKYWLAREAGVFRVISELP